MGEQTFTDSKGRTVLVFEEDEAGYGQWADKSHNRSGLDWGGMWDLSVGESLENDGSLDTNSLEQTIRRDENAQTGGDTQWNS